MKLKNVKLWELHIEKAILAVAVLFFLVVAFMYVLGQPYSVEMSGRTVKPTEVEGEVRRAALELNEKIKPDAVSGITELTIPPYTNAFRTRLTTSVLMTNEFSVPLGAPGVTGSIDGSRPGELVVTLPTPPAPAPIVVGTGFATLSTTDVLATQLVEPLVRAGMTQTDAPSRTRAVAEAYAKVVNESSPRDFVYVSIASNYDLNSWRLALQSVPEEERIPEEWFRDLMAIADVRLERERLDPQSSQWVDPQVIPAPPGAMSFRQTRENWVGQEAQDTVRTIRASQPLVLRAVFPPIAAGRPWVQPGEEVKIDLASAELLKKLRDDEERLRRRILAEKAPEAKERLEQEMAELQRQIQDVVAKLRGTPDAPGGLRPGTPLIPGFPGAGATPAPPREAVPGTGPQPIISHDLTARPGETYRYRLAVALINPLFQRQALPAEQRKIHMNKLLVESQYTPWSDPVTLVPARPFFAVSTRKPDRVRFEVWRVYNGQWRFEERDYAAGDAIGTPVSMNIDGQNVDVDMSINAIVLDIKFDSRAGDGVVYYVDLRDNQIKSRDTKIDRNEELRVRLRAEATSGEPAKPVAGNM